MLKFTYWKFELLKIKTLFLYEKSSNFTPIKIGPTPHYKIDCSNIMKTKLCVIHYHNFFFLSKSYVGPTPVRIKFGDTPHVHEAFILINLNFQEYDTTLAYKISANFLLENSQDHVCLRRFSNIFMEGDR